LSSASGSSAATTTGVAATTGAGVAEEAADLRPDVAGATVSFLAGVAAATGAAGAVFFDDLDTVDELILYLLPGFFEWLFNALC